MKNKSLCVGVFFSRDQSNPSSIFSFIEKIEPIKQYIRDFQFSYHDPNVCKSGRSPFLISKSYVLLFIRMMSLNGYKTTVIMNQAKKENFNNIIEGLKCYIEAGLTGVCTQNNELAKLLKKHYPDLELQSSCLTYKLTYEDFKEEIDIGYSVINPINDIVRDVYHLKRNHEKGLKQKILVAEGCLHKCPFEKYHRDAIANGLRTDDSKLCVGLIKEPKDLILFLKANWITIKRMIELQEYIDVIKLARGSFGTDKLSILAERLVKFVDIYLRTENGEYVNYNILNYTATSGGNYLKKVLPNGISSYIIDNNKMFENLDNVELLTEIRDLILKENNINI